MESEKTVGVIGGMGPDATVELMRRVIAATPADDDADHIHMIVDNNPKVPSRIKALIDGDGADPGPFIAGMARRLAAAGADFLVIPCNTAHHYHAEVAEAVSIPVLNVITLTATTIAGAPSRPRQVGMLASPAIRIVGLFDAAFRDAGIEWVYPESNHRLLDIIKAVKAGQVTAATHDALNDIADELATAGADCLLIACSELSVIADGLRTALPVFDTLQVLTDEIVARAKGDAGQAAFRAPQDGSRAHGSW